MSGYLGMHSPGLPSNNFGILSSSPYVRQNHINMQEEFYADREKAGFNLNKMTGRYKYIAGIIQQQLEKILTDRDSFDGLKNEGGAFSKNGIVRMYLNLGKVDDRDFENPLADGWLINAECLADDAEEIIGWVRKNADGPVSVI